MPGSRKRRGPKLDARKRDAFVAAYCETMVASEAARKAGYSERYAAREGYRLLQIPEVAEAIRERKAKQLAAADLSAARVLEELRRLAFADVRSLFDDAGNLKQPKEWTPEAAAAVAAFEVVQRNLTSGDGLNDTVIKVKSWDKTRSLEMLAKHFKLLVERVEVDAGDAVVARLLAARKRVGK